MKIVSKETHNASSTNLTLITPEIAQSWLASNKANRDINMKFVNALAKKIKDGQWEPNTPDHIGFYEDGVLANGQHRLTAIVKAGIPVKARVDYNIPKTAAICIDTGRSRSFSDNVKIITGESYYTAKISKMISIAFYGGRDLSHEDHLKIATEYKEQISTIKTMFRGYNRIYTASYIMAAVFMAYIRGVSYDDLDRFVRILGTGRGSDENVETVLKLRDRIIADTASLSSNQRNCWQECKKVQNVIFNFVKGKQLTRIVYPQEYRYAPIRIDELPNK